MTPRRFSTVLMGLLLPLLTFFVGMNVGANRGTELHTNRTSWFSFQRDASTSVDQTLLSEVVNDVQHSFYKPDRVTPSAMSYGAAQGIVDALGDPHSVFFPPEDAAEFQEMIQGSLEGIGAELHLVNDRPTINATLRDTPAQKAGLKAGDTILKIDGKDTAKMTVSQAVKLIRGPRGTTVTLSILHQDASVVEEVTITREHVEIPSVKMEVEDGGVAVISFYAFQTGSGDDVVRVAQEALTKGAKSVILDLRYNPGGVLEEAVKTVAVFIESGTVVTQRGRTGEKVYAIESGRIVLEERENGQAPEKSILAAARPYLKDLPLVVLVNESSASASEIVAGALQDAGRARIIGTKTYGKGTVQELIPISAPPVGSTIKLTIAEWFTPKGRSIDRVGLTPDEEVELTEADVEATKDPQMDAARAFLAR